MLQSPILAKNEQGLKDPHVFIYLVIQFLKELVTHPLCVLDCFVSP